MTDSLRFSFINRQEGGFLVEPLEFLYVSVIVPLELDWGCKHMFALFAGIIVAVFGLLLFLKANLICDKDLQRLGYEQEHQTALTFMAGFITGIGSSAVLFL